MMSLKPRITTPSVLLIMIGISLPSGTAAAQEPPPDMVMPVVVVTAYRSPTLRQDLARSITIIGREQISRTPASSVAELLEYVTGLDVRQRGTQGVQADLHVRGGSFEQVLVVLDGVKVSDPQTGHHDLNLPVTMADIDRIEILRGPAAARFGADALDGVVHIITRRDPSGLPEIYLETGQYNSRQMGASWRRIGNRVPENSFRLSIDDGASDGWRHNTDHRVRTINGAAHLALGRTGIDLFQGWLDKRFGANQFYSSLYPEQWEHVRTSLSSLSIARDNGWSILGGRVWWRRGRDEFLLDRTDPRFYRNRHRSDSIGLEFDLRWSGSSSQSALGFESGLDLIRSSNLGDHQRKRIGLFGEYRREIGERIDLGVGAFASRYPEWGWQIWPAGTAAIHVGRGLLLFGTIGRSLRVPSFTDLHYSDPVNIGDPGLAPERAWTVESGARLYRPGLMVEVIMFQRSGRDVIDWVRRDPGDPWQARNIAFISTRGLETGVTWSPETGNTPAVIDRVHVGYSYLQLDHETEGFTSRYVFDHLIHQALVDLAHRLPLGIMVDWKIKYEERAGESGQGLVDLRLARRQGAVELFIAATNLFDSHYRDLGVVPLPGRRVRIGFRIGSVQR